MSDSFYQENSSAKKRAKDSMSLKSKTEDLEETEDPGERLISDKKLEKEERESYKHSFMSKLFEDYDFGKEEKKVST